MNLNFDPTPEELRDLIKQCDDTAGNHVLWVNGSGEVELSTVSGDQTPNEFQRDHPDLKLRCETFLVGNEYVGPEAAEDAEWVSELFGRLMREWAKVKGKREVAYIGPF